MGLRAPKLNTIVQTGPPPNSEFVITNFQRFKCHGDPNGQVAGEIGDECLDLDTGSVWNKLFDDGFKTGWDNKEILDPFPDRLIEMTASEAYEPTQINYDQDGVVTTATVKWPDGSGGTFTRTSKNPTFLTVDGYTITHSDLGRTVTQPTITRDQFGNVTVKPALVLQ